jgi:peptidoglycan/LPS O-acetylase OafA/YrhL
MPGSAIKRPGFSLSLDIIRFAAAMVVFIAHFANSEISGDWLSAIWSAPYAQHAVIIFFILSGLVIAHVASERENDLHVYVRARIVRLYSVVLPMLILVPLLDLAGHYLDPRPYDDWYNSYALADQLKKVVAALTFMHESWWSSIHYFSNQPFWTIAYEFWFYAAFGVLWFLRGLARVLGLLAILAITGPKIFILFPVWLLGVGVWHFCKNHRLPTAIAAVGLAGSVFAYIMWINSGAYQDAGDAGALFMENFGIPASDLAWSESWLADYMLGLMVAVAFISIANLSQFFETILHPARRFIRWTAGATFTIYLLHVPLMFVVAGAIPGEANNPFRRMIVFMLTLAGLFVIAEYTERRKQAFGFLYDHLGTALQKYLLLARSIQITRRRS